MGNFQKLADFGDFLEMRDFQNSGDFFASTRFFKMRFLEMEDFLKIMLRIKVALVLTLFLRFQVQKPCEQLTYFIT